MDIFLFEITQRLYHPAFISKVDIKKHILHDLIFSKYLAFLISMELKTDFYTTQNVQSTILSHKFLTGSKE